MIIFVRGAMMGAVLLAAGIVAVLSGLEPVSALGALWDRVWPILLFVSAITIVAVLASEAGVFTTVAANLARWSAGRVWLMWLLVCALCVVVTVFLSLDTTAVLITPVVIALARRTGLPVLPFALTTVYLANTASLLLPVSNLTNLLAQQSGRQTTTQFVALSWAPALTAIGVPMGVLALVFRRQLSARFTHHGSTQPVDLVLFRISVVVVLALMPLLVLGQPVWIPACIAAVILLLAFAIRRHSSLRIGLIPWSPLVLASGLFLVIDAAHQLHFSATLTSIVGDGTGFLSLLRIAGTGAVSANLVNNLPAYLALEPTAASHSALMALLIGTNCGPLITPWASLATLLWHHRLAQEKIKTPWRHYVLLGTIIAPVTVLAAVIAQVMIS